jgi:hypothetical protein
MRILTALLILATVLTATPPAAAQRDERCFPETGFCIAGPIRDYWERNGGLPVFGYPIAEQRTETIEGSWAGPAQWFERDRLEDHANEGLGVLAGRLGARALELDGRPWRPGGETPGPCRFFPETGYAICTLAFQTYWEQNGGLERFGYPITPAFQETIEGRTYTVQYFERRRMELHPEHAGTPYEVQLGLLGRTVDAAERSPRPHTPDPLLTHLLVLARDVSSGNLNLVSVGRDGAESAIVNDEPRPSYDPREPLAWSPDGSAVAFANNSEHRTVFVLREAGRTMLALPLPIPVNAFVDSVDWSPDGASLLIGVRPFQAAPYGQPAGTIALLDLEGTMRVIGEGLEPRWSPDGRRILFQRPSPQLWRSILVMDADDGQVRELASGFSPRWSPDGARIVYRSQDAYVTTVSATGGDFRRLAEGHAPAWSPDGSWIAFGRPGGDLMLISPDGSDARTVIDHPEDGAVIVGYSQIHWSPDGEQIAYRFQERLGSYAAVIAIDGSGRFQLSGGLLPPRWVSGPGVPR